MPDYSCVLTPQLDSAGLVVGYCVDCPEVPAQAHVPAIVTSDPQLGWNASAISAQRLDGNIYTQFKVPAGVYGVVCGFTHNRTSNNPSTVEHGFYVFTSAGAEKWCVIESGVNKTTPVARTDAAAPFRIERRGNRIDYFYNNKRIYVSTVPSAGALIVMAAMYAAPDGVD